MALPSVGDVTFAADGTAATQKNVENTLYVWQLDVALGMELDMELDDLSWEFNT